MIVFDFLEIVFVVTAGCIAALLGCGVSEPFLYENTDAVLGGGTYVCGGGGCITGGTAVIGTNSKNKNELGGNND